MNVQFARFKTKETGHNCAFDIFTIFLDAIGNDAGLGFCQFIFVVMNCLHACELNLPEAVSVEMVFEQYHRLRS